MTEFEITRRSRDHRDWHYANYFVLKQQPRVPKGGLFVLFIIAFKKSKQNKLAKESRHFLDILALRTLIERNFAERKKLHRFLKINTT